VHKHIESSHLTPEWEAALVLPRGNTWTCEASHEFANVNGAKNIEFWQKARAAGSPLKVFIQPGSAVPPSAWEESGGPPVLPPAQKGFGSRLLEDLLIRDLGGHTKLDYDAAGVRCRITAAL